MIKKLSLLVLCVSAVSRDTQAMDADPGQQALALPCPLHHACFRGDLERVIELLDEGVFVDSKDSESNTPLQYAVCCGRTEIVDRLVKQGASITIQDGEGYTPLHYAAGNGSDEIAQLLVCTSFFPLSPSLPAAQSGLQERCLITLLKYIDKTDKAKCISELAHFLTVNNGILDILVDRVPLERQQSLVTLLKEQKVQEEQNTQQAQEAINLLVKAHAAHHLKRIKNVLEIKNNNYKTARDIALEYKYQKITELFDQVTQAEDFGQLYGALKKSIIATIQERLLIEPVES